MTKQIVFRTNWSCVVWVSFCFVDVLLFSCLQLFCSLGACCCRRPSLVVGLELFYTVGACYCTGRTVVVHYLREEVSA